MMKTLCMFALFLGVVVRLPAWQQAAAPPVAPPTVANDAVVLRAGNFSLTKADYEKLVSGFDRPSGALTTGGDFKTTQSAHDVARLLALVSEAQRRKIDQDPTTQELLRVRGYVLLANALLVRLTAEVKKDEAGTRALWASEKNNYIEIRARQILIRYAGVKVAKPSLRGLTRTEPQAKELAQSLYQKLKQGADFAATAKSSSDDETTSNLGGELPVFTRGAMIGEFETVAYGLPQGGLSEPFKTQYGYHIVQVVEHRPMPFENVRAALENIRARALYDQIGAAGVQLNESYFK